jgi:hypothetical protein
MTRHEHAFTDYDRRVAAPAAKRGLGPDEYAALVGLGLKWCAGCKAWHAREAFGTNQSCDDGLNPQCAAWRRAYQRARYRAQREGRA